MSEDRWEKITNSMRRGLEEQRQRADAVEARLHADAS